MKRIVTGGLVALLLAALLPATALAADVALSFTGLTPTFGDAPVDITGYATPDGTANALTFASTTPAICTTGGADGEIVTLHKAGSCSITASQSGNDASDSFTVAKADPTCAITGYTVAYNAAPHTASGNCLGVDSGILSGINKSATTHTDAGTYNGDAWSFTDPSGDYNPASGTVDSAITPINPDCAITGYNVTFDNANHTALGDCTGVGAVVLLGLDTSATTHKNAGTYNGDAWSFHDANGNYNNDSGTVDDAISKAAALCSSITGYSVTYNGSQHTASGHCFALDGTTQLAGLDLSGTAHTNAGTYLNDPWTFAGTSNYSNTSGQVNDAIAKASQTLGFDISGLSKTYGDPDFSLTPLTVPGPSSSPVTYATQTPLVCTVATATLTIIKGGLCTITASQAGDANYDAAADATSSFTVAKASQTLGFDISAAGKTYGDPAFGLDAFTTAGPSSGAVSYVSQTPSVCTVAGLLLTIHKAGLCTITASQAGDADYNAAADVTGGFTVARANPDCSSIAGYTMTYDTLAHTATGACLAVDGATELAGLDLSGTTHTNAGTYTNDPWTFTDVTGNYNDANSTVNDLIGKAAASCSVTGYSVTYDAAAHTATGSCTGIGAVPLAGLDLTGTTHTNAGSHSDPWTFTDPTGNYLSQNALVTDSIAKANADCTSIAGYAATYDTNPHTATGACFALDGTTALAGLDLSGTTHTNAGTYPNDPWTFTDATGNYNDDSGTVNDSIGKASQTIDFTTTPPPTVNLGDSYNVAATATDGGAVTFSPDPASALVCSMATPTQVHFDARGACVVVGSEPGNSNYLAGTGQQSIPVSDIPPTCTDASATVNTVIMNAPKTGTMGTTGSPTCTDAEGDVPLTYSVDTQGTQGTASFTGSQWTYTPAANALGSDSFTVLAQDTLSAFSAPSTVTVNIVNRPVKAKTDAVTVAAINPKSINVLANDLAGYLATDPTKNQDPGQPLTITAVTQGTLGTVSTDGHTVRYDPNGCSYGSDLFSYTVSDGLTTGTAYVAVTVAKPGQGGISKTPLTNTPTAGFILGSKTSATVPVRVAWCGLTSTSAKSFRVVQSSNGGVSFPTTLYASTKLTSTTRSVTVGGNYAWRVRTVDGSRRVSAYATSLTSRVLRFQDTDASIVYTAGWSQLKSSSFSGGSELYATSTAATATLALPAGTRAFAIVSSRASNRGSFRVYVDGNLVATVSQKVTKAVYQIVVYARSVTSTAPHTIVILPAGNGRIDLDAILTLQ